MYLEERNPTMVVVQPTGHPSVVTWPTHFHFWLVSSICRLVVVRTSQRDLSLTLWILLSLFMTSVFYSNAFLCWDKCSITVLGFLLFVLRFGHFYEMASCGSFLFGYSNNYEVQGSIGRIIRLSLLLWNYSSLVNDTMTTYSIIFLVHTYPIGKRLTSKYALFFDSQLNMTF